MCSMSSIWDSASVSFCDTNFVYFYSGAAPGTSSNSAPKTPNAFALFTKENYQKFRKPGVDHKDVMTILSQEFRKIKLDEASKQKK